MYETNRKLSEVFRKLGISDHDIPGFRLETQNVPQLMYVLTNSFVPEGKIFKGILWDYSINIKP